MRSGRPLLGWILAVLSVLGCANALAVTVRVQSAYGATQVFPEVAQSGDFAAGQMIVFSAPKYVYLDRYKKELDPTEANIRDLAFYRARSTGLTIDGGNVDLAGDNTFVETLETNITVVWLWELEYAVITESATASIDGLQESLGNPAIGGTAAPIGKHWFPADTLISASIDGIITPANSPAQDARFSTRGYTIENAPNLSDHFLEFNGKSSLVEVPTVRFLPFGDFTIEFWARRDPVTGAAQQEVVRFVNDPAVAFNTFPVLRVGFESSEDAANPNGMFLSTNETGGIVAEVPGAYVDEAWHHWAWVHDAATDTLRCFRDGREVLTAPNAGFQSPGAQGVSYALHESATNPQFPAFPLAGFLSGPDTIEAESASSLSEWTVESNLAPFLFSEGQYARAVPVKAGYLEYTGLNIPAGAHRIVARGVALTGVTLTIEINGQDSGATLVFADVETATGIPTNIASGIFTTAAPITSIRLNSPSLGGFVALDQIQVQSPVNLNSVAAGLSLPITGYGTLTNFSISPATQSTNFAFDYLTALNVDEPGVYQFRLNSDDGSILSLDGQEVVNNDGIHAGSSVTGSASLEAGLHALQVGYFQAGGARSLSVEWNPPNDNPDLGFVPIPDVVLSPGVSIVAVEFGNRAKLDRPFGGGLNNIRFWSRTFDTDELLTNSITAVYGTNTPNLEMEFTFDHPNSLTQTSTEGNNYLAGLLNFGPPDWAAFFETAGQLMRVPPVTLPAQYTLEARAFFPLLSSSGKHDLFSPDNNDHQIQIDESGNLGLWVDNAFHSSGYSVQNLVGWHMIGCTKTNSQTTFYVDGQPVGTVNQVVNEPVVVIGNHPNTAVTEAMGFVDEIRIWSGVRSTNLMESQAFSVLSGGESNLLAYWNFDDRTARDLSGNGYDGSMEGGATIISPPFFDTASLSLSSIFPEFLYQPSAAIARIGTTTYTLQDWIRITWLWDKTFRLQVTVDDPQFEDMLFLTAKAPGDQLYEGTDASEVWLPQFSEVTVGAYYRTTNGASTLSSIVGATKLFRSLTPQNMNDGTRNGRATREFTFPAIEQPGTLTCHYDDTVYHAILPLGVGLDASSTSALDMQIVPDLAGGYQLKKSADAVQVSDTNPSRTGGSGAPNEYDQIHNTLYTVWPGVFTYKWDDVNSSKSNHTIQVASGFPTNTIDTGWQIENKDGYRLDTNGVRILDSGLPPTTLATLPPVPDAYPGSPAAHYNYVYATDPNQTIPVDLDEDDSDAWFFQRQAFADNSVVNTTTHQLTSNAGGQSVLVYSYRTNAAEVATGDETREALAVRAVDSIPQTGNTLVGNTLSFGNYRQLHVTSTNGLYAKATATGGNYGLGNNEDRTYDFWLKLDASPVATNKDRVVFEIDEQGPGKLIQFGFRAQTNKINPGGFYYSVGDYSQPQSDLDVEFKGLVIGNDWHHWAIVISPTDQSFYLDGNLVANLGSAFPLTSPPSGDNVQSYGYSKGLGDYWLNGSLDNWRIWTSALTTDEIRAAMMNFTNDFGGVVPVFAVSFDGTVSGATINKDSGSASGDLKVVHADGSDGDALAALDLQAEDGPTEVASRLDTKLDTAELSSGFALNSISDYNPNLYNRGALVGQWGDLFPVNWGGIYSNDNRKLLVAYYQNPYLANPTNLAVLHPNVAWPYVAIDYNDVQYPTAGKDKDNRIYISSRLGTEGEDANGIDQLVFSPALYDTPILYNQPDRNGTAGFNPNEEHALIEPSIKSQLVGDPSFNLGQSAAFALQHSLNLTNRAALPTYTSDPWVLVQYQELASGQWHMAAYKVEETRQGSGAASLFPALDPVTHMPTDQYGQPVSQPTNAMYDFEYTSFAGDVPIPVYPLNLVVGSLTLTNNRGGNIQVNGIDQRTLWNDRDLVPWIVSGNGRFFYQNWYPLRDDFWFDFNGDGVNDVPTSTPIAWLPDGARPRASDYLAGNPEPQPVKARYSTYWRNDYPILKRGETMTYTGGENLEDNPLAQGLPGIVNWASAQLIFDSSTPAMVFNNGTGESIQSDYSARVIRPLDRYQAAMDQTTLNDAKLTPGSGNVQVEGERWYFKGLTGSLQKRFYYDSLLNVLVYRGRLNDLESGDPKISQTPISLYALEPNVMTTNDFASLLDLPGSVGGIADPQWMSSVTSIYTNSQNPSAISGIIPATDLTTLPVYWAGVQNPTPAETAQFSFYTEMRNTNQPSSDITPDPNGPGTTLYEHLDSLGTGAALVPNPSLLTNDTEVPHYVTLVENNNTNVNGAVALHIIEIGPARYRGGIKLVEAQNAFDEKINLRHTADFGGNTAGTYYEWWVHDIANLSTLELPDADPSWQLLDKGLGKNQIEFSARPDIVISDHLFLVRYGEKSEFADVNNVTESEWRLVSFESPDWSKTNDTTQVPYQWAGAANSPQLQADGSRKYIPQLVMGWVKRVLDTINPYEARYTDFIDNESPATYSSMIQEAGKPFNGDVALNSDKNVVENVGLIELYETVLDRAKALTLDEPGGATSGANQALLLAATRLASLYELLAREACSDAQNPTIPVTPENGLASAAPFVFAFYNEVPTLLDEELGLLRGTDFVQSYPVYNRLFWNYVKGLGEAAYNANYNIYDVNQDGFIDESDAAALYPQGHGDAWGHFLSASQMHYELLRNPAFNWEAKSELYGLLDNVIPTDYLDEKSFARIAAAKARTGKEIVAATYRQDYTQDPDGQWQGYKDPDEARAWGVSEWASRAGQAALFDWFVGNAITPVLSPTNTLEGLDRIDRLANQDELSEVSSAYLGIQQTMDAANNGGNPVGLDNDALSFDLDPLELEGDAELRKGHFEQIYDRAITAGQNALAAFQFASQADQQLKRIADDTLSMQTEALKQDLSYRNQLIEIFGTPYEGTIGPGQVYPEGYDGPDTELYMYIDQVDPTNFVPAQDSRIVNLNLNGLANSYSALNFVIPDIFQNAGTVSGLFKDFYLTQTFPSLGLAGSGAANTLTVGVPVLKMSDFAFQAPPEWGSRAAPGSLQKSLNDILLAEINLNSAVLSYRYHVQGIVLAKQRLDTELGIKAEQLAQRAAYQTLANYLTSVNLYLGYEVNLLNGKADLLWKQALVDSEYMPRVVGISVDASSIDRGSIDEVGWALSAAAKSDLTAFQDLQLVVSMAISIADKLNAQDQQTFAQFRELMDTVKALSVELNELSPQLQPIAKALQQLNIAVENSRAQVGEGQRLLKEREAYNIVLAGKAQRNRYADMITRLTRNDALTKYQSALDNALRYTWLAAKAYDYETSLDPADPAAATTFLQKIVSTRQLGNWVDGQPQIGNGGLAEILAQLKADFDALKGQLGINNPQNEVGALSLRYEDFRIPLTGSTAASSWVTALKNARVDDLWQVPEFRKYCRPFAEPSAGPQPGIVIPFSTEITPGLNVFGNPLGAGDHAYSTANYATKIFSVGVLLKNYNNVAGVSSTPRIYLVPVGTDRIRISNAQNPAIRDWTVVQQRIPVPFIINASNLSDPNYIPSIDSLSGTFGDIQRFGDFRAYDSTASDPFVSDTRLVGRSVWNTHWLLIIPGASLNADPTTGINNFIGGKTSGDTDGVQDILLQFQTYSHEGV